MSTSSMRTLRVFAVALSALLLAGVTTGAELVPQIELLPAPELSLPPLPDPGVYPVQLVLDDDTADATFGAADGAGARQSFFFQRFAPLGSSFRLEEIWILFPPVVPVGSSIEIAVMSDVDGDPTTGASLLTSFLTTTQVADGVTFSIYSLPVPLEIDGTGDVLIGYVNRYLVSGGPILTDVFLDTTSSNGRSWLAVWNGADPPSPPALPGSLVTARVDDVALAGNWMIRGFGTQPPNLDVPALTSAGLIALALLLAAGGLLGLRRLRGAER